MTTNRRSSAGYPVRADSGQGRFYQLITNGLLAILLVYGLVAALLTLGTTFSLRILPTIALGLAGLAILWWWGRGREFAGAEPETPYEWKPLWIILAAGVAVRIAWWAFIKPLLWSDYRVYFNSAAHLVNLLEYRVPETDGLLIAYRPPGTAFLLAAVMKVTGVVSWAPLMLNLVCFVGTGFLMWLIIRPRLTRAAALGALCLLVFWPSDVMFASLPQSESPSILGVTLLMFLVTHRHGRLTVWASCTGLLMGLLCLVRNSNLILVPLWMLVALREPQPWRYRLRLCVVLIVATFLPILPWTYRNYRLLGVPVLVATNGGENLYSANNDTTSGSWDEESVRRVRVYLPDEVKMDRVAMQLAKDWIRSHPWHFAKLAVKKLRILMSGDDEGPYATLEQGIGYTGPGLLAARIIANAWWLILWGLVLISVRYRAVWRDDPDVFTIIAVAVLPAFLFFVFQSQPRYHVPMVPPLVLLAGFALAMKRPSA